MITNNQNSSVAQQSLTEENTLAFASHRACADDALKHATFAPGALSGAETALEQDIAAVAVNRPALTPSTEAENEATAAIAKSSDPELSPDYQRVDENGTDDPSPDPQTVQHELRALHYRLNDVESRLKVVESYLLNRDIFINRLKEFFASV